MIREYETQRGFVRPFAYWMCIHNWAIGARIGTKLDGPRQQRCLFVRLGNNGRGPQEGRPGWHLELNLQIRTDI